MNFHRWYCNKTDFRGREKKYNEVKNRTEKIQKGFEVLELDLEEIQGKVDQYLAWLKKKEEQVQLTQPQGYSVKDAEAKVQYLNVSNWRNAFQLCDIDHTPSCQYSCMFLGLAIPMPPLPS